MQDAPQAPDLQRQLSARTLSMITLGGSLGTGIFLASGNALSLAGPGGTLLAYTVMGIMVYYLMGGLGELAAYMPSSGAFYVYASRFIDPSLGYALAWNYWFSWPITIASEIAASALLMNFWFPGSPPLLWCGTFLGLVLGFNVISTKAFGLAEYWFSFIKITVILLFIAAGLAMIAGLTEYQPGGFKYWSIGDAPFHDGWLGVLSAFVAAGFSFQGTELLGIAAGESDNPAINVPRAVKLVFWRILLFFVLSILIISLLIPYTAEQLTVSDVLMSPFTFVFQQRGLASAALLMNGVVLIAILSTANSGLYVSSRLLWFLAREGHFPKGFTRVNRRGVPLRALALTGSIALLAFLSSLYGSGRVYFWLLNAGSLSGFITWMGIAASHYRFRKAYLHQGYELDKLPYLAKGYPYGPLFAFSLCLLIIGSQNYKAFIGQAIDWQGVMISYLGVPLFLSLWLGHKWLNKTRHVTLAACRFDKP